jgi:hypothetical protein
VWTIETAPDASHMASIEELSRFNVGELLTDIKRFLKEK